MKRLLFTTCLAVIFAISSPLAQTQKAAFKAEKPNIEVNYKLFPNPTSDRFSLSDDEGVKNIRIYTIIGKEIKSFDHMVGQSHPVDDLQRGIYIVRLFDSQNEVLKVLRLNRK